MSQIYLISPPKIDLKEFPKLLQNILKTNLVPVFQLRLKDYKNSDVKKIAIEIKKICQDYNCLFVLNDFWQIALEIGGPAVHVGEGDGLISQIRKNSPKNFVIGASCYNSRHLAIEAAEQGADYLAFGAFFPTATKIAKAKADLEILTWGNEILNLPIVAIGGINDQNAKSLLKADFLAVISYIWENKGNEIAALQKLHKIIS